MLKLGNQNDVIAVVKNDKNKIVSNISCHPDYKEIESIELHDNFKIQIVPRKFKERDVFFIAGESGSGKSTYVRNYIDIYKSYYPKNEIYLISYLEKDETLDNIKGIKRIKPYDEEFLAEIDDIDIMEFKDSIVIFDDVDSIPEKKIKTKIYNLLNKFLRLGRHSHTTILFAGHELFMANDTKSLLNESSHIVVFPITIGNAKFDRLLDKYIGFDREQIKSIKDVKTRSLTIIKGYPKLVIGDRTIMTF